MRKNDLIKILENVKGNPEIMLWNGHIHDVMPISKELDTCYLSKYPYDKKFKYMDEIYSDDVKLKKVLLLQARVTGKTYWDRCGRMEY